MICGDRRIGGDQLENGGPGHDVHYIDKGWRMSWAWPGQG